MSEQTSRTIIYTVHIKTFTFQHTPPLDAFVTTDVCVFYPFLVLFFCRRKKTNCEFYIKCILSHCSLNCIQHKYIASCSKAPIGLILLSICIYICVCVNLAAFSCSLTLIQSWIRIELLMAAHDMCSMSCHLRSLDLF